MDAEHKVVKLAQMGIPMTLNAYNRRLAYAKRLGETGYNFPPGELGESESQEDTLPPTRASYSVIVGLSYLTGLIQTPRIC